LYNDYIFNLVREGSKNVIHLKDGVYGILKDTKVLYCEQDNMVEAYKDLELENKKIYLGMPYNTDSVIIVIGNEPVKLDFDGQNNYGSCSLIKTKNFQTIIILAEND